MCHYFKDLLLIWLSIYLDYQLHLLFAFAVTMLTANKDYYRKNELIRHHDSIKITSSLISIIT